jgi:N-methylhydantoinase A/oxoprolinase/acetone carboxylase beta subunit
MSFLQTSRGPHVADIATRTNTDGVILDLSRSSDSDKAIIAWQKTSTTRNPNDGINNVIKTMFERSNVDPRQIASVTIGTTHFINSVVERDRSRLAKVGVIRLCGPFSKDIPIGIDWPPELREIICGYCGIVDGGLEIDGSLIAELDTEEVKRQAEEIKSRGISSIAVVGIFSPIDIVHKQEEAAADVIRQVYPEADVVCSKDVANIGFLERENAAILNASILPFARRTIRAFQRAIRDLKLDCPVFVTQNDGTILHASAAARLPIRTFSSGPTNSMRGAAFLMQGHAKEAMMVIDVGGTTTDVGLLEKNGFPRQAAAYSEIAGVRTNFSYPDVRSVGLGGGSIVKRDKESKLIVGPESVGYQITEKAIVFGGDVATATDYTVLGDSGLAIGDQTQLEGKNLSDDLPEFKEVVKSMLERIVDQMKTSPDDIPVVLVGGGAIIAPESLRGASRVVKPQWSGIANAIGAATARVSGVIDSVENTDTRSKAQITEELSQRAIDAAVHNGALRETVSIAEMDSFPLQYIANKSRMIVTAVGDFDYSRTDLVELGDDLQENDGETRNDDSPDKVRDGYIDAPVVSTSTSQGVAHTPEYITTYKPEVIDRQWFLSETDLEFISTGCYILGTGGGGSPYQHFLRLRELKRAGAILRVISPNDLKDDDLVACGGGKGSPQVSIEKPYGDE